MRLTVASCLALFWAVQPSVAVAQGAAGLRSGILPDGTGATEATAVLFQLSPTANMTFSTSAVALQDGWIDRSDEGATAFTARLRASYQATPALKPFVEAVVTHQQADGAVDAEGSRPSETYGWRAGVAFDGAVSGAIAVGYAAARFDDPALTTFGALTVDGSLAWAPTGLTMVTVAGSTALAPADVATSYGSVTYDGTVDLAYAWQRDFDLLGTAVISQSYYQGTDLVDTRYRAGFGATWKMNATHRLTAGYHHEWRESTDPSRAYEADAVRVELRMLR